MALLSALRFRSRSPLTVRIPVSPRVWDLPSSHTALAVPTPGPAAACSSFQALKPLTVPVMCHRGSDGRVKVVRQNDGGNCNGRTLRAQALPGCPVMVPSLRLSGRARSMAYPVQPQGETVTDR